MNPTYGGRVGTKIALLYSISSYVPWAEIPTSPWDNLSFASKGEGTCGAVGYANYVISSLHQIGAALYVPTAESIN